jgi:hypothetical protein
LTDLGIEYELFFRNGKGIVDSSRWGLELEIIEAFGWSHAEYLAAPHELILEAHVKMTKRALIENERAHG